MKKTLFCLFVVSVALVLVGGLNQLDSGISRHAAAGDDAAPQAVTKPVEDSMHEFMEYVFQPPYKRLKASLASEPEDSRAWKVVKSDSLILAEVENLLLIRLPEEDAKAWACMSILTRDAGAELYQAARKRDYAAARKSFGAMLTKCNSCHKQFADGKYQLEP